MAVVTITGSDVSGGSPSGGGVGGASNLTTAGAVPYVASAGVLTQDATALFWDATNDRLGIGTAGPGSKVEIQNTVNTKALQIVNSTSATGVAGINLYSNVIHTGTGGNAFLAVELDHASSIGTALHIRQDGTGLNSVFEGGNVIVGGTTNGNYRLDIAASGSSGTVRVFDQTATTGSTLLAVQAGAGQSSNNLQEWRNNAGTAIGYVSGSGYALFSGVAASSSNISSAKIAMAYASAADFRLSSDAYIAFNSATNVAGTVDAGIARASAGVIEINNGTAGTLRDLLLRYLRNTGVTVATLPAAAAGNAGTRAYVTDANATAIGSVVAGGGANKVMVWSNGTNWLIYAS